MQLACFQEIRKQRASLKAEQDSNRQLERVNNGYLKSKEDEEHETYGLVRAGAKEMYRLMLEESRKLTEFASFVKDTVDPDCPELDLFICLREKAESVARSARKPNTCAKTLDNSAGKSV